MDDTIRIHVLTCILVYPFFNNADIIIETKVMYNG